MSKKKENKIPQVVMISNPGKDVDGVLSLVMAASLADKKLIKLSGVLATGGEFITRLRRAMFAKGCLIALGHPFLTVAQGGEYYDNCLDNSYAEIAEVIALEKQGVVIMRNAQQLLQSVFAKAAPKSLTVVINAQMSDLVTLFKNNSTMPFEKVDKLVIQGGFLPQTDENSMVRPDSNIVNLEAAEELYYLAQQNNLRMVFVPQELIPQGDFYEQIATSKQPVAQCMNVLQTGSSAQVAAAMTVLAATDEWRKFGSFRRVSEQYRVFVAEINDEELAHQMITECIVNKLSK